MHGEVGPRVRGASGYVNMYVFVGGGGGECSSLSNWPPREGEPDFHPVYGIMAGVCQVLTEELTAVSVFPCQIFSFLFHYQKKTKKYTHTPLALTVLSHGAQLHRLGIKLCG